VKPRIGEITVEGLLQSLLEIRSCTVMKIDSLDHLLLTVKDMEAACTFYSRVLGAESASKCGSARQIV
jgi:catechol-2,3-dioxygenase